LEEGAREEMDCTDVMEGRVRLGIPPSPAAAPVGLLLLLLLLLMLGEEEEKAKVEEEEEEEEMVEREEAEGGGPVLLILLAVLVPAGEAGNRAGKSFPFITPTGPPSLPASTSFPP